MKKSATDVMEEALYAAVIDAIAALKAASKGLPNTLLRDIGAIHANTAVADLPKEVQAAVAASVRTTFTRLMKEGYTVIGKDAPPPRAPSVTGPPRGDRPYRGGPGGRPGGPGGPRGDRPGGGQRPGGGPRGPKPDGGPRSDAPRPPRRPK
ncbi:hypothetical protein ACFOMD_06485 [Sphingoaurantiacus capsulatus]|uniref:Uncharacterized protein n=1 Tax=Sphingoaurantiacus capsulatus TaxID=1771310 RepID=A0ABV7XB00_9SPHN